MASGTAGSGICTGVAPSAASMREFSRVAARIFRPFQPSSVFTPLAEEGRRSRHGVQPQRLTPFVLVQRMRVHVGPESPG